MSSPTRSSIAASALSAQVRASPAASSADTSAPTLPVRAQLAVDHRQLTGGVDQATRCGAPGRRPPRGPRPAAAPARARPVARRERSCRHAICCGRHARGRPPPPPQPHLLRWPDGRHARRAGRVRARWSRGIPSQARLHVVTGKGGTGKTTVAAALALSLAEGGKRVLLVEVESRQAIAQLFDIPPMPYAEQRLATHRQRRRAVRPGHRPRTGDARVPRDVLRAQAGRQGAQEDRRRRLRHHARAGPARRAADRQGEGVGRPGRRVTASPSTTRSCWTHRRPVASGASSTPPARSPKLAEDRFRSATRAPA